MVDANLWNELTTQPFTSLVRSNWLFSATNFLKTKKKVLGNREPGPQTGAAIVTCLRIFVFPDALSLIGCTNHAHIKMAFQ